MVRISETSESLPAKAGEALLDVARGLAGWKLATMKTHEENGALVTVLRMTWCGGYVVPETKFRAIPGVSRVHSHVENSEATVWINWEPHIK